MRVPSPCPRVTPGPCYRSTQSQLRPALASWQVATPQTHSLARGRLWLPAPRCILALAWLCQLCRQEDPTPHLRRWGAGIPSAAFLHFHHTNLHLGLPHLGRASSEGAETVPIVLLLVAQPSLPTLSLLPPSLHSTFFTFLGIVFHLPMLSGACPIEINAA